MNTKTIAIFSAVAVVAGAAVWYGAIVSRTNEIPPECQFTAVTSSGSKKLSLEDLKQQLEIVDSPIYSLTPGIEGHAKKLRECIAQIEGKSPPMR